MADSTSERLLLCGDGWVVAETAAFLAQRDVEFFILAHTSAEHFPAFQHRTVGSVAELSPEQLPTVVIDVSSTRAAERLPLLSSIVDAAPNSLILASTATCTATELAAALPAAAGVIGFNGMPGWTSLARIEVAPSLQATADAREQAERLFRSLGFEVELVEDRVGLVIPRVLALLINEAAFAVMEHIATADDVDTAVKLGVNYPHGLLEWADMLGIDWVLNVLDALYDEYRDMRYRACVLLRQYVRAGWLGRKSGRGFFTYAAS